MKNGCTLYIVRHGETQWNVKRKLQGQADSPLTKNGELQARDLGKKLHGIHFDAIFSSDLLRAKRTAEIIALERKLAVLTTNLIRERAFGSFEGKPYESLRQFDGIVQKLSEKEKYTHKMHPEIESDEELATRFIVFLRMVSVRFTGKTVLAVAHGAILRAFLIHIGFATYQNLRWGGVKNTAYVKLETDGVDFFVKETFGITLTFE